MNVPQETLDGWRRSLDTLRGALYGLARDLAAGRVGAARDKVQQADDAARRLALALEASGADRPAGTVRPPGVPLPLLDTPANRRYLEKLREAWEAGLAVDRERYGEDIGTDGEAQVIEMLIKDKETEIHGPVGVVRE